MASRPIKDRGKGSGIIALNDALLRRWSLPIPGANGDKEDRGRVLVVGGSNQMPGAVILAAIAALRASAGQLTIATGARVAPMVAQAVCESRILSDPEAAVLDAARRWNAVVALKGATTFIGAPDGSLWRHEGGNIGLAMSGSGDVLSGLIAGFAARGATIEQASAWGVALHAHAGSALATRVGTLGYLARDLAGEVPTIMQALMRKPRRS